MTDFTDRQLAFIDHYLQTLNGAESARRAGYGEAGARVEAHRLLTNANIRAEIDRRLADQAMSASEVLARLADHARGTMADVLSPAGRGIKIDLKKMMATGAIHRVKKYTRGADGSVSIELYDAQAALGLLGKHHRLFTDNVHVSGELTTKGYVTKEASPDAWDDDEQQ